MVKRISLRVPEIGFIAGTRGALGAGLGLLLADKMNRANCRKVGWVLVAIGAATTVPIIVNVVRRAKRSVEIAA
jgi:hypothetical protein